MNTHANPTMLKWARERRKHSVTTIAAGLKKKEDEIISWETGKDSPSYSVMEKLAYKYYKIPLALFFFPEPPKIDEPAKALRRLPSFELEKLSSDTLYKIDLGQSYQDSLIEIFGPTNNRLVHLNALRKHRSISDLAVAARQLLGLRIEEQIRFKSPDAAFNAWRHSLEGLGIFTFKDSFKDRFVSGIALMHDNYPVVLINNSNSFTRQIFTLIHELGHIIYGVSGITDIDEAYFTMLNSNDKDIEVKCNQFAGELLLPTTVFKTMIAKIVEINEMAVSELAHHFKVSREVVLRKLLELGKISSTTYNKYSSQWTEDYLRNKKKESKGNYYLTKVSYLGESYTKQAFSLYRSGEISNIDLARHLNMKAMNIGELEGRMRW